MSNGIAAFFGILCFMILVRTLTPADFGSWILYLTTATFFESVRAGILHTPLVRFAAGEDEVQNMRVIGSSWGVGLLITLLFSMLILSLTPVFPDTWRILRWYPLLAFSTIPHNYALWILQSRQRFGSMLVLRLGITGIFLIFLIAALYLKLSLVQIVIGHLCCNLVGSVLSMLCGWSHIGLITKMHRKTLSSLLHFGKYSMGTMLGSNLLRSSDTFIIGWLMGPVAVSMYSIPLKLAELVEIPLRSLVATALPRMSKLALQGELEAVRRMYEKMAGIMSLAVVPLLMLLFIFAEQLVVFVGGEKYGEAAPILRVFIAFMALLPIDRYMGITLDSLNKPKYNFYKVCLMVLANCIGDIVVIQLSGSLQAVAAVTIFTFLTGIYVGRKIMYRETGSRLRHVMRAGWGVLKDYRALSATSETSRAR